MHKIIDYINKHRYNLFYSFLLICLFAFIFVFLPKEETKSIVKHLENKTFDIRQNIVSQNKEASKDIVIITIDDPSYEYLIEKYGDWPIPRNIYAEILDYVQAQNPKFVAFDLLFIKSLNRIKGSDAKLVNGFKNYQNTYTAFNFDDYSFELRKPAILDEKLKTKVENKSTIFEPYQFKNCRLILDEIIEVTDNVGHINTPKSDDGFIRAIPMLVQYPNYTKDKEPFIYDNYLYMTTKLAVDYLNKYENENISTLTIDEKNNLLLGKRKIPLTKNGEAIINWYGNQKKGFKYVYVWELIKSMEAKQRGHKELLPEDLFKDKIVYIGTSVFSLSDIKTVPISKYMPGVEIHATLLNNIIDNIVIKEASNSLNIFLCGILAIIAGAIVFKINSVFVSNALFAISIFAYTYFATYVMDKFNLWIWMVIPICFAIFIFVCSYLVKYLLKSRDFEHTYKLATTDGLTELYNHRFFQEQMKTMIAEAKKENTNFSLVLLDIDFFKKFNDTYGHQAGDAVLKHVARTLKLCVRKDDYVCRYGGEEMTVILNNAKKEQAILVAKKICETIASKTYELADDLTVNITVSIGTSTYPENGKTPAELVEYADECLYKAKENGRNQVGFKE